jgi:hypothetical protein
VENFKLILQKPTINEEIAMENFTNQQQALKLAKETLTELFKETSDTASIMRRCLTISTLLGDEQEAKWIKGELEGYKAQMPFSELQKIVPEYRKVRVTFKDYFGRPIVIPPQLSIIQDEVVTQTIGEIDACLENGLTFLGGGLLEIVREMGSKYGITVYSEHVSNLAIKKIVEQVRNRALDFINRVICEQNQQKVKTGTATPDIIIIHDEQTEDARLLLYSLENELRQFVSNKLQEKGGTVDESILKDWNGSKKKEFMPPRQPIECPLIDYSSFDQLKKIIVQNENWEKIFRSYFGRQNGVISRLNELDDIRDTIAHNRILSTFDFNSFKTL